MSLATEAAAPRRKARARAQRPAWQEKPKAITTAGKVLAMVLITAAVVAPFWVVLSTSLSSSRQVTADGGYSLWPREFSLHAFHQILTGSTAAAPWWCRCCWSSSVRRCR